MPTTVYPGIKGADESVLFSEVSPILRCKSGAWGVLFREVSEVFCLAGLFANHSTLVQSPSDLFANRGQLKLHTPIHTHTLGQQPPSCDCV